MPDELVQPISDKTPKLPGFAANKSIILVAIAVVGIIVVALSNTGGPVAKKPAAVVAAPSTPDQVKAFSAELQRESASYEQEQKRVAAMQAEAQRLAALQGVPAAGPQASAAPVQYAQPVEVKRRSNIAFSFRDGAQPAAAAKDTPESQLTDIRGMIDAEKAALAANIAASQRPPAPVTAPVTVTPPVEPPAALRTFGSTGKTYKLFEGTIIETVLTNRLNGSFTGPVNVLVTTSVYSHDREHVLIPQGSRILGEAARVGTQGQQRLAIVFHRIIMPDGATADLDKFTGLDSVGATGLKDKVDNHWTSIGLTAVALGVVQGVTLSGTGSALTANGFGEYRQGLANATGQAGTQVLSSRLSILPTIEIREGHRVRVWLNKDVDLPAYDRHTVPGDL